MGLWGRKECLKIDPQSTISKDGVWLHQNNSRFLLNKGHYTQYLKVIYQVKGLHKIYNRPNITF